jgi:hypothetical protein
MRHEFEPYAGYRFFKGEVSILLHAAARFKPTAIVTSVDLYNLFRRINKFLQTVGAYEAERQGVSDLLNADHFPEPKHADFYKFMPDRSLDYFLNGSFQFGSIQYYRGIEQQNSKDAMEGLSNIAIKTPKHLIGMSLTSGYNFGIFCGARNLSRRSEMSARFGPRIIKIVDLKNFAEDVRSKLGARRFYFNRVIYNDLKMFRVKTLKSFDLIGPGAPNDNFDPQVIIEPVFNLLCDSSFLPSLFMKPTRFSIEEELRLVFEMPTDIPQVLRITDKALLKHIEVIS